MKQISNFNISRLLVASHYEYHNTVVKYITDATAAALHLDTLFPPYRDAVAVQLDIINRNQSLANTELLRGLDTQRDALLSRLYGQIDMAARSPLDEEKAAGIELKRIVSPYRGISGNEYTKQTAEVRGLLRDLGTDAAVDLLDVLSAGTVVQKLRQTNNAFATAMDVRVATQATRSATLPEHGTDRQRKIIDAAYAAIIQTVNAFAIAAPTAEIEAFIDRINSLVEQYKRVITSQRPGGTGNEKGTGKKDEEPTPQPEEETNN